MYNGWDISERAWRSVLRAHPSQERLFDYLLRDVAKVNGWLWAEAALAMLIVDEFQHRNSIRGSIGEIGVWEEFREGEIIVLAPGEPGEFEVLEDAVTVVVKSPSVASDKYVLAE